MVTVYGARASPRHRRGLPRLGESPREVPRKVPGATVSEEAQFWSHFLCPLVYVQVNVKAVSQHSEIQNLLPSLHVRWCLPYARTCARSQWQISLSPCPRSFQRRGQPIPQNGLKGVLMYLEGVLSDVGADSSKMSQRLQVRRGQMKLWSENNLFKSGAQGTERSCELLAVEQAEGALCMCVCAERVMEGAESSLVTLGDLLQNTFCLSPWCPPQQDSAFCFEHFMCWAFEGHYQEECDQILALSPRGEMIYTTLKKKYLWPKIADVKLQRQQNHWGGIVGVECVSQQVWSPSWEIGLKFQVTSWRLVWNNPGVNKEQRGLKGES